MYLICIGCEIEAVASVAVGAIRSGDYRVLAGQMYGLVYFAHGKCLRILV